MAHLPDAPLPPSIAAISSDAEVTQKTSTGTVSEIYENGVPEFAAAALARLHGSLYATLRHLELCEEHHPAPHTWVFYSQGEIRGVLLFRMKNDCVQTLTEMFMLTQSQAQAFSRSVFDRYPLVKKILFNAVCTDFDAIEYPGQRYVFSENYILDLPENPDQYLARLGKSTRKTIKAYGNRLRKDHPDFIWQAYDATELQGTAQQALINQLQSFKQASMALRNKQADISLDETCKLLQLASECGLFSIGTINGQIRAGALSCRIGDNYVMLLSAADPELEKYRLGLLACYWSVCDCIERGARQCHLLWGRYQYKSQLLAVPQPLLRLVIYRSVWHMMGLPSSMLSMFWRKAYFDLRHWLLVSVHERQDFLSRLTAKMVMHIRQRKRGHPHGDAAQTS